MTAGGVQYLSRLLLEDPLDGRRDMIVAAPWRLCACGGTWEVEAGMVTDGASIPRFWWRLIGPPFAGRYRAAAVWHDAAYRGRLRRLIGMDLVYWIVPRERADWVMFRIARCAGVEVWRAWAMYATVRVGGGRSYRPAPRSDYRTEIGYDALPLLSVST